MTPSLCGLPNPERPLPLGPRATPPAVGSQTLGRPLPLWAPGRPLQRWAGSPVKPLPLWAFGPGGDPSLCGILAGATLPATGSWDPGAPQLSLSSPLQMAEAGFIHCPTENEPDLAQCFFCFKELEGWEPDDDPM